MQHNLEALFDHPYVAERSPLLTALRPYHDRLKALLDQGVTRFQIYRRFSSEANWSTPISQRQFNHILGVVLASPADPAPRRAPRSAKRKPGVDPGADAPSAPPSPSSSKPTDRGAEGLARKEPSPVPTPMPGRSDTAPIPASSPTPPQLPSLTSIGAAAEATTASIEDGLRLAEEARRREIMATADTD